MGRPVKWPPTIHPHRRSGRCFIRVRGDDYWLGKTGSEEARKEYARLVTLLAPAGTPPPKAGKSQAATVLCVIRYWEDHDAARHSEKELKHYRRALLVLARVCGGEPAADFDSARLEDVRAAMTSASWMNERELAYFAKWKREARWSARVANRQVVRIRTVWRFLERKKQVPKGSWGELRLLAGIPETDRRVRQRPKARPATWEDVQAVCARIRSRTTRAMLELQWHTGMRSGEVRRMRPREIDTSGDVWLYRPAKHKNAWRGQDRVIPLGPKAQAILAPRLRATDPGGHVWLNEGGRPYTSNAYGLAATRAGKKCGRAWFRPYCARHGAKLRITREFGLDAARAVLGQLSVGTTNDYAAGIDVETATAVAGKLG